MTFGEFIEARQSNFGALTAFLGREAKNNLEESLYTLGREGDPDALIGTWRYSSALGAARPVGPVNLANVSATPIGVVASGSGTAYTVAASPLTLGTSGTVQAWDISAGAPVGAPVAYTRSGTSVTLASSRTLAAGDLLLDVSRCELRLGTDWIPQGAGAAYFSGSALRLVGNSGVLGLSLPGLHDFSTGPARPLAEVRATFGVVESTTTDGAFFGVGLHTAAEIIATAFRYRTSSVAWRLSTLFNDPLAPSFSDGSTLLAPGTASGAELYCRVSPATADRISFQNGIIGGNFGEVAQSVIADGLASGVHPLGPSGPPDAAYLAISAGAGQLDVTITEMLVSP